MLLVLGAIGAYFLSLEPASEAYDQALVDVGIALGERIRSAGEAVSFDLPGAAEQALRTDKYDTIYYHLRASLRRLLVVSATCTVQVCPPQGTSSATTRIGWSRYRPS